jgi:predicted adenylyl cyclase CyaB
VQNIEIKTPLADAERIEARLRALGARKMWTRKQTDTFFSTASGSGWLKLRESEGRLPELISYERSTSEVGPRLSNFDVLVVSEPAAWKRLLGRVLPIDAIVEKERTLWIYEHTRIHLDRVMGLGEFLELETVLDGLLPEDAREETARLMHALSLDPAQFLSLPYKDLLKRKSGS